MIKPMMAPLGKPKRRFVVVPEREPSHTPVREPAQPVKTPEKEPVPA